MNKLPHKQEREICVLMRRDDHAHVPSAESEHERPTRGKNLRVLGALVPAVREEFRSPLLNKHANRKVVNHVSHWMCMCASVSSDWYTSLLAWNTECKSANGGTVSFVP